MNRIERLAERLIFPLAVIAVAVGVAELTAPGYGVAVLAGAIGQARVERERAKRIRGETRLLRALRTWKLYG